MRAFYHGNDDLANKAQQNQSQTNKSSGPKNTSLLSPTGKVNLSVHQHHHFLRDPSGNITDEFKVYWERARETKKG